ncbi:MAG TPA: hypothetical protein VNI55_07225 [Gaiellaceae bacterium]|nr:hypothetical protein [Gaiellaceae bacterium]
MRRAFAWIAGGLGIAALLRFRRRPRAGEGAATDPAEELRRKLAQARGAGDDRDEFDAAEGTPVDEAVAPKLSIEERRAAIHAKAQEALGSMNDPPDA